MARKPVDNALDALDNAYKHFFRRWKLFTLGLLKKSKVGYPRFKRRGKSRDSFAIQDQSFRAEPRAIKLGKIGMVRTHQYVLPVPLTGRPSPKSTRYLQGRVLRLVVSRRNDRWFCAIMVERERPAPEVRTKGRVVGVDLGLSHVITTSSDEVFAPSPQIDRKLKKLRRLQRSLERREPGSNGHAKQMIKIGALHSKVSDTRAHYLHRVANHLVENYDTIVIEGYDVQDLGLRSGPTRGQRGSAGVRRKIMQSGLGELRRLVEYKSAWNGVDVCVVNGKTDQTCSKCSYINKHMRVRRDSKFSCEQCGHTSTRQKNTAEYLARIGRGELPPPEFLDLGPESRHGQSNLKSRETESSAVEAKSTRKTGR